MRTVLIELRKKAGLTQEQMARLIGIDRGFYAHIEKGRRTPSLPVALRIAQILGRSVEEIFWASDVAFRHKEETKATG